MAIGTGEFDPSAHVTVVAGIQLEGFGEESAIKITPLKEHRTAKQGIDKRVVSAKTNSTMARLEVVLIETSPAHRKLLALLALDQARIGGAGAGRFDMTDLINGINEASDRVWIEKRPERVIGAEVPEYTWTFLLSNWQTDLT